MRFALAAAALLAATSLGACMGPEGNPNGSPYANEPGGTIAVKPETVGMVSYNPYATPAAAEPHAPRCTLRARVRRFG